MTETKNEQGPNQKKEEDTLLVNLTKDGKYIVNWKLISGILRAHDEKIIELQKRINKLEKNNEGI